MNIIGLLRHGPTAWNHLKQIQGIADIPLDASSFDAAPWQRLLGDHGPWDHIVTSSLRRCRETCQLLFPGRPYDIDSDLREQDWGEWTGKTLKEIIAASPGIVEAQEKLGWDFTPPGGECRRDALARAHRAIRRATGNQDGERILFITHSGIINIILNHLENTAFVPEQSSQVAKRALHLLRQDGGQLSILKTNIGIQ